MFNVRFVIKSVVTLNTQNIFARNMKFVGHKYVSDTWLYAI